MIVRRSLLLATPALILPKRLFGQALPWPGPGGVVAVAAATYTGPGDVVSGATFFIGLRAYTSASIGGNMFDLKRSSDSTSKTFVSITGGGFDTSDAFLDGSTYTITKLYDQTGNGNDFTTGTGPTLSLTAGPSGANPTMQFNGSTQSLAKAVFTQAQPFTISSVAKYVNNAAQSVLLATNGGIQFGYNLGASNANKLFSFCGSNTPQVSASDGSNHAVIGIFDDGATKSAMAVDGTTTTGSLGSTTGFSAEVCQLSAVNAGVPFNGTCQEVGMWPSSFSNTQNSNMSTNQHSYWGF